MPNFIKKHWIFFSLIVLLLILVVLSVFVTPQELVNYIGVKNIYLVSFLVAVFGGLSTLTGLSFFVSVAAFASGGADPFLLGLFGGLGVFISDSIFFLAARHGVRVFKKNAKPISLWLASKMEKFSLSTILIGVYIYIGLTPLPNDILMVALAFMGMSFKRLAPVLMAGSISVVWLVAYFGETLLSRLIS